MDDSLEEAEEYVRSKGVIEVLAAIEHERWAHWQQYLHSKCKKAKNGDLTIPAELAERWSAQMSTPYADLTEEEKKSDREQVARYLPVIYDLLSSRNTRGKVN